MPDKRFHTILLDADGTLFDFKKAESVALIEASSEFGITLSEEDVKLYSEINSDLWMRLERGEIRRENLRTQRFSLWFEHIGISGIDIIDFDRRYAENLSVCGFLYEGAKEFLSVLCDKFNLYLVTNGSLVTQRGRIKHSGIESFFQKIFISEEIGFAKPDVCFFDYVFENIGLEDRSGVIILGDSLSSDIMGGRNAGISTCKFSPDGVMTGSSLCDYEVSSYDEFLSLVM